MRPIGTQDCAAAAGLIRAAFATLMVEPAPSGRGVSPEVIAQHLAAGGGGAIMDPQRACILWRMEDGCLHVSRLSVHPADRNRGLATAMLRAAEAEALRCGLLRLRLSTRLAADGNRRLFARFGFVEGQRHAHPGYEQPTYVDMEKALGTQS